MNDEFKRLDAEQQAAVRDVIAKVRAGGGDCRQETPAGEAYAYPSGNRVHWGFNASETGCNIARGVIEVSRGERP